MTQRAPTQAARRPLTLRLATRLPAAWLAAAWLAAASLAGLPLGALADDPVPPPEKPVPQQPAADAAAPDTGATDTGETAAEPVASPDGDATDGTTTGSGEAPATDPAAPDSATADPTPPPPAVTLVIGAAPVAGSFFPTAGAICREINREQDTNGLRCLVEETEGSAENLQLLRDGKIDIAIVQSDWAFYALNGTAADRAPPFTGLNGLVALQPQVMTLVAGLDSGIESLNDLAGKRIAIGPADSALNTAARNLLQVLGLADKATLEELPVEDQVAALCGRQIDAILLPLTHPSGTVEAAIVGCGARLVSLENEKIAEIVASWPFLAGTELPTGLYPGQAEPVAGYGTVAMLVTSDRLPEQTAYGIVKALFAGLDDMKAQHPIMANLSAEQMAGDAGLAVPLHPGALRFYEEQGWR